MVLTVNSWNIYGADGKQLKPFLMRNLCLQILKFSSLYSRLYLAYLKFLAIKGTRFQTKAILAFDQDYQPTKSQDNYSWGSNLDDLSAQYFDALLQSTLLEPLILISRGSAWGNRGHRGGVLFSMELQPKWLPRPTVLPLQAPLHSLFLRQAQGQELYRFR